jgi:hypothetical protein
MGYGNLECIPFVADATQMDIRGNELSVDVAEQCAWQEMGFAKDLEPIADPEDLPAFRGEAGYTLHDGAEAGDGSAAEVVAVGKTAGKDDAVIFAKAAQVRVLMPKHDNFLIEIELQSILHVPVTVRSGENDYAEFHGFLKFRSQRYEKARPMENSS